MLKDMMQQTESPFSTLRSARGFFLRTILLLPLLLAVLTGMAHAQTAGDGSSANPYQITSLSDLAWMSDTVTSSTGKYYKMMQDIDASDTANWNDTGTGTDVLEGFKPIGYTNVRFQGFFDGGNFSISNLTINRPTEDNVGLFGSIGLHATVKNLAIENCAVTGRSLVGGLVGNSLAYPIITNCSAAGTVSGNGCVGGLIGRTEQFSAISGCYSTCNVTGSGGTIGGLVGWNTETSITSSYATGAVTGGGSLGGLVGGNYCSAITDSYATGAITGSGGLGGLIGRNTTDYNFANIAPITNCYATGTVTGTDLFVGGLVGETYNFSMITGCYATGSATSTVGGVGGLVGGNGNSATITACYATGVATGANCVGGLVGRNWSVITNCYATGAAVANTGAAGGLVGCNDSTIMNSYSTGPAIWNRVGINDGYFGGLVGYSPTGTVTSSYWDMETSGLAISAGGTGLSDDEMQDASNYVAWDFANIWAINSDVNYGYPYLRSFGAPIVIPQIITFSINNGATQTNDPVVTLNNLCTGSVLDYMASEDPSFAGATWQIYSRTPSFILSTTALGAKTVYFQVRDIYGTVSNVKSANIVLEKPIVSSFTINNGATASSSCIVTLNNTVIGVPAYYMASESSSFTGATWIAYSTACTFRTSMGVGSKTVYFKIKNAQNVESDAVSASITLSNVAAPTLSTFAINSGASSTTNRIVTLNNTCTGTTPFEYIASESSTFVGAAWQPYSTAPSFTLSASNGTKTVYFKVRNAVGVESAKKSDTITFSGPVVSSLKLNKGATTTASRAITLNNTCTGTPTHYMVSESAGFSDGVWLTYATAPTFNLSSGDTVKTVYFKVKNSTGQESSTVSDTITLSETIVVTSFVINNGATATESQVVTINNAVTGSATHYMVGETFDNAQWTAYSTSFTFTLLPGCRTKTIYFKAKNAAGDESEVATATINLDVPVISTFTINNGATTTVNQHVTLNNTCTGNTPVEYMVGDITGFAGATWQPYSTAPNYTLPVNGSFNGRKYVYFKVRNAAGGESDTKSARIDFEGPTVSLASNLLSTAQRTIVLHNGSSGSPTDYMVSELSSFSDATWQTYATDTTITLSSGNGIKTVYCKVRNSTGQESPTASISINLYELVISNFTINDGAATTENRVVTLNYNVLGNATACAASESPSFPVVGTLYWNALFVEPPLTFNLSAGNGPKTIYFKMQNSAGVSAVVSASIVQNLP